jgi:hypothetical protein
MNRALARCIVKSLRVHGAAGEHFARLGDFSERDWRRTFPWLDDSGLALYLLDQIKVTGADGLLPVAVQARLARNLARNLERLAVMREEFAALNRRFDAAGVEYAVLKGFALIPDFCPVAALRCQYDYDYLVSRNSADKAKQVLLDAGYTQKARSPGLEHKDESVFAAQPLSLPKPDEDFYSPFLPRFVELHLSLWESDRDMVDLELPIGVLGRRRLAEWDGLRFPALSDFDGLIFQALHTFQHILGYWCRISCFLEVAHFLKRRRLDAAFWERFRSYVENYRFLPEILSLVLSMSSTFFDAPLGESLESWVRGHLHGPLSVWIEHYASEWAFTSYPGSKLSLHVHRQFIQDRGTWKAIRRSRLLPFHRPASVVEPGGAGWSTNWKGKIDRWRFFWMRLKFHISALLGYGLAWPRWKIALYRSR